MDDFATYILGEERLEQKMVIAYYMAKKTRTYFDKSVILKAEITRMFLNYVPLNVDKNEVLTAMLLCNCKKVDNLQKLNKLQTYAKDGAEYLSMLGFDKRFCKICEGVNRYNDEEKREKESDILELVDQFSALLLRRAEREAFTPQEALVILKERNLKNVENRYLEDFIFFVNSMEDVYIKDNVEVPVLRKLAFLCEKEKTIKSYITALGSKYSEEIDVLMSKKEKRQAKEELYKDVASTKTKQNVANKTKIKLQTVQRYTKVIRNNNIERALFSPETTNRVLNHKTDFKV